jgi:hypothetical protein
VGLLYSLERGGRGELGSTPFAVRYGTGMRWRLPKSRLGVDSGGRTWKEQRHESRSVCQGRAMGLTARTKRIRPSREDASATRQHCCYVQSCCSSVSVSLATIHLAGKEDGSDVHASVSGKRLRVDEAEDARIPFPSSDGSVLPAAV